MDSSDIFVYAIATVLVNALILHLVIGAVAKASQRAKYEAAELVALEKK